MGRNVLLLLLASLSVMLLPSASAITGDIIGVGDSKAPDVWVTGAPTAWTTSGATATLHCDDYRTPNCRTGTYKFNTSVTRPGAQCPQTESSYFTSGSDKLTVNDYAWVCGMAKDDALNINFSHPLEFRVDNSPPVTILKKQAQKPPNSNGWFSNVQRVTALINCTDVASGCDMITYCRAGPSCTPNIIVSPSPEPGWIFRGSTEGVNYFVFYSNDSVGNVGGYVFENVSIDNTPPATTVDSRPSDSFVPITGHITDATSGGDQAEYKICSDQACNSQIYPQSGWAQATMGSVSGSRKYWSFVPPQSLSATSFFFVRSNDTAGNQENPKYGGRIIPDSLPPTVTVGFSPASAQGKQIAGIPQTGYWWNKNLRATLYCHDQSPPCTMEWCHDAPGQAGCQPRTSPPVGNVTSLPPFSGDGVHYLRVNATDSAGNSMKVSVHSEPFGIDTVKPSTVLTVTATGQDQSKFRITPSYSAKSLDSVNISAYSTDPMSGIDRTVITYVEAGEARVFSQRTHTCTGGQQQCDFIYSFRDTGLMYRVESYDNAGNVNSSPSATGWHFLVDHPLANFVAHESFVTMGTVDKGRVMVRNLQNQDENVTIWFEGYALAWFEEGEGKYQISDDGRELNVTDLAQGESRTFSIGIMASEPGAYELYMNATASVSGVQDADTMRISSSFPPDFPGLEMWAMMLLILAASAAYCKKI